MPSKKKKYNARFPAGRIKKIMQSDEEIGKVAQAVPVIISRTLELFVESLLSKTLKITKSRNAKTLTTSHMKQCIVQEQRFDFLRELVKNIPDINVAEEAANYNETDENGGQSSPDQEQEQYPDSDTPYDLSMPSTSTRRREAPDQNGGTHSMHLRSGPAQTPAPLQVSIDLTQEDDHRVHLKHAAPNSSSSSSVIMHTKRAIAAGSAINSDCKPPKLSRSESTPPAHQNKCRQQRLKPPLHSPSILPPASPHYNNNNISKFQPKQKPEQQSPPQTAAIIPAAPILSYGYRNKPIVNIDYSNVPMSVVAGASSATTAAPPLSAPANIASLAHATSAFQFDIAAPVINIDLSNLPVPSSRLSLPAANNGQLPFAPLSLSSSSSSNLLEPKATSSFYISSLISPIKSNNNKKDMGGPSSASKSLSFELDEDYDDI